MMAVFDSSWVARANTVLAAHSTGVVPEFRAVLRLRFDRPDVPDCWIVAEHGGQRFSSTPVEPADIVVTMPFEQARAAFAHDDQNDFVNRAFRSGDLWIEGDFAKARFFAAGLVRNATPGLVRALRAIG